MFASVWLLLSGLFYSLQLHSGSFPKPLTPEEECYYLACAAQGDLEARNIMVERNLRLAAHVMKNRWKHGVRVRQSKCGNLLEYGAYRIKDKPGKVLILAGRCLCVGKCFEWRNPRFISGSGGRSCLLPV